MRALVIVLSLLIWSAPALAQTPRARIAAILTPQNEQPVYNGGVLAVADGRVVYRGADGFADFAAGRRLRPDDVFQAASMAKPFTSTAVLQLRDRGLLRLDDRVSQHLEGFPFDAITIRHLLTHTSGLPDLELFETLIAADPAHVVSAEDLLPALSAWTRPLAFEPGAAFRYSNTNYQLLALIVARVSQQPFGVYVRDHIFRPAGMRHSYVLGTPPLARTRPSVLNQSFATMYAEPQQDVRTIQVNDARLMRRLRYETFNMGSTLGDQNLFTTLDDLRRFDAALRSGRVLSHATQAEAYAPVRLNDGTEYRESEVYIAYGVPCSYGMGWETCAHPDFGRLVGHAGYSRGIATMFYRNVERRQMIAMFDNADMGDFAQKFASIANALNGAPPVEFSRSRSLTRAYGRMLVRDGAGAARAFFDAHRGDTAAWTFTPRGLNQLGYDLLRNGHEALALEAFRLNVELNPDHAGYWDSLGEGLGVNGMRDEAIAAYRRSLELNPDNESGRAALQRLEASH
ncbi:serine hydrolase domain-containing protein [Terricaulis sp.]|uniref:serine hydrolase domain-containing protein n=1 Tax=Terricaulis sp. TaxID=2768686 RepID=UPI002AC71AFE|nr:serine hydrolase [Terricaulis sp.]MDZ4690122.1 serine hydrolase [Terricaulis sp.]